MPEPFLPLNYHLRTLLSIKNSPTLAYSTQWFSSTVGWLYNPSQAIPLLNLRIWPTKDIKNWIQNQEQHRQNTQNFCRTGSRRRKHSRWMSSYASNRVLQTRIGKGSKLRKNTRKEQALSNQDAARWRLIIIPLEKTSVQCTPIFSHADCWLVNEDSCHITLF